MNIRGWAFVQFLNLIICTLVQFRFTNLFKFEQINQSLETFK